MVDKGVSGEERPFEPLIGILTLRPLSNLYLDTEVHWDHYDKNIPLADVTLALSIPRSGDGRITLGWITSMLKRETRLQRERSRQFGLWLFCGRRLNRDISGGSNLAQSLYLDYQSQCWGSG